MVFLYLILINWWLYFAMKSLRKLIKHIGIFYTYRAVLLHIGFVVGIFPSTFVVALVVLVISQVILWIYPWHARMYGPMWTLIVNELMFHWMPVILFIYVDQDVITWSWIWFAVGTLWLYVIVHGHKDIYRYYHHTKEIIHHIWN